MIKHDFRVENSALTFFYFFTLLIFSDIILNLLSMGLHKRHPELRIRPLKSTEKREQTIPAQPRHSGNRRRGRPRCG